MDAGAENQPDARVAQATRLLNVALGMVAAAWLYAPLVAMTGGHGGLLLSKWLLDPWVTQHALALLPRAVRLFVYAAVNFFLPVAILILLFVLLGLHRKTLAMRMRWTSTVLGLSWGSVLLFAVVAANGGNGEFGLGLWMMLLYFPVVVPFSVFAFIAGVVELTAMASHGVRSSSYVPRGLLLAVLVSVILPAGAIGAMFIGPNSPRAISLREDADFATKCREVGVVFKSKLVSEVATIGYVRAPSQQGEYSSSIYRVEMDDVGRVHSYGGFAPWKSAEADKKVLLRELPVDEAQQADLLVYFEVSNLDALKKPKGRSGAVQYQVTLKDRRNDTVLAKHTYVIDRANNRACGANIGNTISTQAFIYDALHR
ncbi:MAG: hypothetical protein OEW36_13850 [Hylemonella sp.]|nr:hypothetical protein [Hylemonella sp.]